MTNDLAPMRIATSITLTSNQLDQFAAYERLLLDWNNRFNLTAIRDSEGIRLKHFADSLSIAQVFTDQPPTTLADIGSGAGFPGLPLKILYPTIKLTLVESVGKKCRFLEAVCNELGLHDVIILNDRAEALAIQSAHREQYACVTARAVAALPTLCEYMLPLTAPRGLAIAQKGDAAQAELDQARNAIKLLGGKARPLIEVSLPGLNEKRSLVIIDKIRRTPTQYPRAAGKPARTPL